jgi:hypothetical protein
LQVEAFRSGASGFLLHSYGIDEITKLMHEAHRNPGAPKLFPNLALYNEAELDRKKAATHGQGGRISLVGTLRQLCNAPRRQTAS